MRSLRSEREEKASGCFSRDDSWETGAVVVAMWEGLSLNPHPSTTEGCGTQERGLTVKIEAKFEDGD